MGLTTTGAEFARWKYQKFLCENLLEQKSKETAFDILCFESTTQWQRKGYSAYVGKVLDIEFVGVDDGDCDPIDGKLTSKYFDGRKIPVGYWALQMQWYLKYGSVASTESNESFSDEDAYYYIDTVTKPDWIGSGSLLAFFSRFDEEKVFHFISGTNKEVPTSAPVSAVTSTSTLPSSSRTAATRRSSRRSTSTPVNYNETTNTDTYDIVDETLFRFSSNQLTVIQDHIGYVKNDPFRFIEIVRKLKLR